MKLTVSWSMKVDVLVIRLQGEGENCTSQDTPGKFLWPDGLTTWEDWIGSPKFVGAPCKIYYVWRCNKTIKVYDSLLGQLNYARTQKVCILKNKNYCACFLKCTKFKIGDLASGLDILTRRRKRRVFSPLPKYVEEQVTYVFNKNYLVLLTCKLGPEWAGTRSGDRLVFRVILLYCTGLCNTRYLKEGFKEYANKTYFFFT